MKLTAPKSFKSQLPKFNNGHWSFPEQLGKGFGFVYLIRYNYMEKFYIGRKAFRGNRSFEKDWRKYTSSSNTMSKIFEERPREEFDFFCLEQYKTRGAVGYAETWSLCYVNAPLSDSWYNRRIEKVTWGVNEPITERHIARIDAIINMENPDE